MSANISSLNVNLRDMFVFNSGTRSRILEHTISLRFLGLILRVLRLEVSVYNVFITNQFQTTFAHGGVKLSSVFRGACE